MQAIASSVASLECVYRISFYFGLCWLVHGDTSLSGSTQSHSASMLSFSNSATSTYSPFVIFLTNFGGTTGKGTVYILNENLFPTLGPLRVVVCLWFLPLF